MDEYIPTSILKKNDLKNRYKYYIVKSNMSSSTTLYRRAHPEYYEKEKARDNIRMTAKYHNDPEYREKNKQMALARYYRLKQQKLNASSIEV